MSPLHAVILAGGAGTRFWPASRKLRPKQFLPLADGESLLAATVHRLSGLCDRDHVWIVTNREQAASLPTVLPDFPADRVIVEPAARDTAPCIALATATIAARDPGAQLVMLPADHRIAPIGEFERTLRRGLGLADARTLVTFGIPPTFAATGFGYVECGEPCDAGAPPAHRVRRFREKPDAATARDFLAAGTFLWNSGIFAWTADALLAAMDAANPELAAATRAMTAAARVGDTTALAAAFATAPRKSIDFAVMERAPHVAVVRTTFEWNDVGSFAALAAIGRDEGAGNRTLLGGGAASLALDARDNIVYAEGPRTVGLLGVDGLVVVALGDAVFVTRKELAEDIKRFVEHVRASGRDDLL